MWERPEFCNGVLERELSAYRFVDKNLMKITSKEEISEIEEALSIPLSPVQTHLDRSLQLLANRKSPDCRNSIKESISAVESFCNIVAGNKNLTLDKSLDAIAERIKLHGALKGAFSKLYGYTSSADGIRHALTDEPNLSFEDAKFMLVACSAFVNYLSAKASKAGIKFPS